MFEKSRACSEDLYHIFYFLMNASNHVKNMLKLDDIGTVSTCLFIPFQLNFKYDFDF